LGERAASSNRKLRNRPLLQGSSLHFSTENERNHAFRGVFTTGLGLSREYCRFIDRKTVQSQTPDGQIAPRLFLQ
jgi:hypothetical protein